MSQVYIHLWALALVALFCFPVLAIAQDAVDPENPESEELQSLRLSELEAFGPEQALIEVTEDFSRTSAGLSSGAAPTTEIHPLAPAPLNNAWLTGLSLPDLPVRWDPAIQHYLDFYRNHPRGQNIIGAWIRRVRLRGPMVREVLREEGVPQDLIYLSMIESGFDPRARSGAGAVGMWQFVEGTGEEYGLSVSHWRDERMDPEESTRAGARYLKHLHERFGGWELAFAAYNMGYGALLRAMRKYNTNDYWALTRIEAGLPYETRFYVAKVLACAIIGRNPERFGLGDAELAETIVFDRVNVPAATRLTEIARAAETTVSEVRRLNPSLLRDRVPPGAASSIRIPQGKAEAFRGRFSRQNAPAHTYVLRFGETLEGVADAHGSTARELRELNGLTGDANIGAGTRLLVPRPQGAATTDANEELPVVAVPSESFAFPERTRRFYQATLDQSAADVADATGVTIEEIQSWNNVDPEVPLTEGLWLQLYINNSRDLTGVVLRDESQVRVMVVNTDEFHDYQQLAQGRVRFAYEVVEGDTLGEIAERFGLSVGSICRINNFSRSTPLQLGQNIVIYAPRENAPEGARVAFDARLEASAP